jgi:hypothetical protein
MYYPALFDLIEQLEIDNIEDLQEQEDANIDDEYGDIDDFEEEVKEDIKEPTPKVETKPVAEDKDPLIQEETPEKIRPKSESPKDLIPPGEEEEEIGEEEGLDIAEK